jgi:formimidoylglutamate deiminase
MNRYFAEHAWLPEGWQRHVAIDVDHHGMLAAVTPGAEPAGRERLGEWVLPGMPNLHSHAFQRAMAGMAERQTDPRDSFWTWREVMYGFAQRIRPDQLQAIATQLYVEMLEAGYTQVCEFHYLHHDLDGRPHARPAAMAEAIRAAAREAGIGLTLLPVLYMTGGFDGRALSARQQRFGHHVDAYLDLYAQLAPDGSGREQRGLCFHSLRAVPEDAQRAVLAAVPEAPAIHIHIAEQTAEVDDCLAVRGVRPVRWLLDRIGVDPRWTLVHATHLDASEVHDLARSRAVAGLCPTTEANLGDGLFALPEFLAHDGVIGIGSDSHISVSPVEELRWLEYGQRLLHRRRNLVGDAGRSCGETLFARCLAGGAQASAAPIGALAIGQRADLVVLDADAPPLLGANAADLIDRWVFSGNVNAVREVMVGGRWTVREGRHTRRGAAARGYAAALAALREA